MDTSAKSENRESQSGAVVQRQLTSWQVKERKVTWLLGRSILLVSLKDVDDDGVDDDAVVDVDDSSVIHDEK